MGKTKLKAIDFFCGGGGMTCGLKSAGIEVIAGVDYDGDCAETYERNNKGATFVHADITKLPLEHFEKQFNIEKNNNNLIFVGCSPCQYWSVINTSKEKAEKTKNLIENFQSFVEYYRPGYVLVENVPGIVTGKGSVLQKFIEFLTAHGYSWDWKIINMNHYGIPQTRKRFSLIASRLHSEISLPKGDSVKCPKLRDVLGEDNGFPKIPAGYRDQTNNQHITSNLSPINLERLKSTPKNGGDRLSWKNNERLQLPCFVGKDHNFKDTFGRMFWDKPAPTITTKFFSISNGRFAHPEEDRAISLREGATLQTFPKTYVFYANSIAAIAKLIGNAVPPKYAELLGKTITKYHVN